MSSTEWVQRVRCAVESSPIGAAADFGEAWLAFARGLQPVVTVFGAYDTGKSSLIRRLLVDSELPVPDWLTISARHETFTTNEVDLGPVRLRDTPGVVPSATSGDARSGAHTGRAMRALGTSDALCVVLTPQLITAEKDIVSEVLALGWQDGVLCVINRFDEAGIDPEDDRAGYADLVKRKSAELRSALGLAGVPVFAVAADPFQTAGSVREPNRSVWDGFRDWDGIAELLDYLSALPARFALLRGGAEARYWRVVANDCLTAAAEQMASQRGALRETEAVTARVLLFTERLDAIIAAAEADLDGAIEEALVSGQRLGAAQHEELVGVVGEALQRWGARHNAALEKVAREFEVEVAVQSARPGADWVREMFGGSEGESVDEASAPKREKYAEGASKAGRLLREGLTKIHERHLGMTLAEAGQEFSKAAQMNATDLKQYFAASGGFKSAEQMEQARKYLNVHAGIGVVGPLALELGGLLYEAHQERAQAEARKKRREELRRAIKAAAEKMGRVMFEGSPALGVLGWRAGADDLRRQIDGTAAAARRSIPGGREAVARLEKVVTELTALLAERTG